MSIASLPALAVIALLHNPAAPAGWVQREAVLMGTVLRIAVAAPDRARGIRAIEDAFAEVRRLDSVLSTWRDDSEIMALNRAPPGQPVRLSPELRALLLEVLPWADSTDGAFDPAIGPLVDAWDLRGHGRIPSDRELARARSASGLGRFEITDASGAVRRDPAAWLDTGGFGKGAALRQAARVLHARGIHDALLNFGGQVLALGSDELGLPWAVPVAHPSRRGEPAARLRVRDGSVSTSAQSERAVMVNGRRLGHVLDPRTGLPVASWGSVTVAARDPLTADILSTALLVLGPDEALRWADGRSDVGVLVLVERDGRVLRRWNAAMSGLFDADTLPTGRG